jgi:NAD(P)-dependent dehydrogenase (short-subunit alcohol dehydrogenase family)
MRVILIGATGTIGKAILDAIAGRHEVVPVSRGKTPITVDLADKASIVKMFQTTGKADAVVCAAGPARFKPFDKLTDDDFTFCLANKLMGQVNLVRSGVEYLNDGGSFTLTSGILSRKPMAGSAAISLVNAGLEGFARAAALELPRGLRINVVSPNWVVDTLKAYGMDPSIGTPVEVVARAYVSVLEGTMTGEVIEAL